MASVPCRRCDGGPCAIKALRSAISASSAGGCVAAAGGDEEVSSSSGTMTKNDLPGFTPAGTATSNSRPAGVLPLITWPGVAPSGTVTDTRVASRLGFSSAEEEGGTITAKDFPTLASAGTSTSTSPPRGVISLSISPGWTPSGTVKCILRPFLGFAPDLAPFCLSR